MENQENVLIEVVKLKGGGKMFRGHGDPAEIMVGIAVITEGMMGVLVSGLGMSEKEAADALLFSAKLGIEDHLKRNAGGNLNGEL